MGDLFIYDENLDLLDIIDDYESLIWVNRYWETGDCEVYIPASFDALTKFSTGRYLKRSDDDMICRINRIELTTDVEDGDHITISGVDSKCILDQRVIWNTAKGQGNAEAFVRGLVSDALIYASSERIAYKPDSDPLVKLDTANNLPEGTTEQISYKNLGEKIREICRRYGWGYYFKLDGITLAFGVYAGADRSSTVIFAQEFDNLISTNYTKDATKMTNVALIGGEGEGSLRIMEIAGDAEGAARYETYVDARNLSRTITYGELISTYPLISSGGYGSIVQDGVTWKYRMSQFDVQIWDDAQLARMQSQFPGGTVVNLASGRYYRLTNVNIANLQSSSPASEDIVTLLLVAYKPLLVSQGYDNLSGYGVKESFTGEIDPLSSSFEYKKDYFLGDIVTIRNDFGLSVAARIIEINEIHDANGYRVIPKFEYLS